MTAVVMRSERDAAGRLKIYADLPYRDRLRREGAISGFEFDSHPFRPALPRLLVRIANASDAAVSVNELQFRVVSATPDVSALPALREKPHDYRFIKAVNEGWGGFEDPVIRIDGWGLPAERSEPGWSRTWRGGVVMTDPCAAPREARDVEPFTVDGAFDDMGDAIFDLAERVPDAYDGELFVCATGTLTYADAGAPVSLSFRTRVSNHRPLIEVAGISIGSYDLYLDPERSGYTAVVPVDVEVPPGETATAEITAFTDRTSTFVLTEAARTASGAVLEGETFEMEIFRPRRDPAAYMSADEFGADGS
jgi:hypothetical protein